MQTKWRLDWLPKSLVPPRMIEEYKDVTPSKAAAMFPGRFEEHIPGFWRRLSDGATWSEPGSFVSVFSRRLIPDPWYAPGNPGHGL